MAGEEWAGVITATAPNIMKGAEDLTLRKRLLLAMLKKRGRIELNQEGYDCSWQVEFSQPPIESYADGNVINFSRHDTLRRLTIDWRGYKGSDMMTSKEKEMNKGTLALVKRYDRILPGLIKSLTDKFCSELFVDGYASGNEARLHGLESFLGSGTTVATDRLAKPDDTYGGISTAPGSVAGQWTSTLATYPNANIGTDWPDGSGSSEYDFNSPKLINWSASNWGTSSQTWASNAIRVLRQAKMWQSLTAGPEDAPDLCLLAPNMFYDWMNAHESKLRSIVPHKEASDLGFSADTYNQDGMAVTSDFDVPVNCGYIMNLDKMSLASLHSKLFVSQGPTYDIRTDAYLFTVGFFGNCKYQPKFFGKTKNYAT